jgi:hypothetical protein
VHLVRENPFVASLLIISGPPGAGKSAVANVLADRFEPSVLVEGDAFFACVRRGFIDPWLPEARDQNDVVLRAAATAAGRYVSGGYDVLYDGVVGPWSIAEFARASGLERVHYAVLLPALDRCVNSVATRHGHGFMDEAATRKMHREFMYADVDGRHLFVDPPEPVEVAADWVLEAYAAGDLVYRSSE